MSSHDYCHCHLHYLSSRPEEAGVVVFADYPLEADTLRALKDVYRDLYDGEWDNLFQG